jgi:hypothetical protein
MNTSILHQNSHRKGPSCSFALATHSAAAAAAAAAGVSHLSVG